MLWASLVQESSWRIVPKGVEGMREASTPGGVLQTYVDMGGAFVVLSAE